MKNLFKALANFQQEVPVIHKATQGYGYSYSDLTAIFKVINPLLKKHSLGFTQLVGDGAVKTIVFHVESSESIETTTTIPQGVSLKGMNDFQVLGSAITYIRRYAISAMLGLITDKDLDACGEQVVKNDDAFIDRINNAKTADELKAIYAEVKSNKGLVALITARKKELENG